MSPMMRKDELVRSIYHDYELKMQDMMIRFISRYNEIEFRNFVKTQAGFDIEIARKNTYFLKL